MSNLVLLKPRVTEKSYAHSEATNTYVFEVPKDTNRLTVAEAVAKQFDVTVTKVNILVYKGKAMRFIRKGGKVDKGNRSDIKKAYVTLKKGDKIPVFAAIEEEEADKKKAEAKQAKKASKGAK